MGRHRNHRLFKNRMALHSHDASAHDPAEAARIRQQMGQHAGLLKAQLYVGENGPQPADGHAEFSSAVCQRAECARCLFDIPCFQPRLLLARGAGADERGAAETTGSGSGARRRPTAPRVMHLHLRCVSSADLLALTSHYRATEPDELPGFTSISGKRLLQPLIEHALKQRGRAHPKAKGEEKQPAPLAEGEERKVQQPPSQAKKAKISSGAAALAIRVSKAATVSALNKHKSRVRPTVGAAAVAAATLLHPAAKPHEELKQQVEYKQPATAPKPMEERKVADSKATGQAVATKYSGRTYK